MSNVHILYTTNDTVLEIDKLRNDSSGAYLAAADVAVTLLDEAGVEVEGQSWPLSLLYVTGSRGVYRVTLPSTLPLVRDTRYTARIVANAGPGLKATWDMECVARPRN